MPSFLITYDLRKQRNYDKLYECLREWKAIMLLESVYLADLKGPAGTVRDILKTHMDADDGVAVLELVAPQFDWATSKVPETASEWLKARSP